MTASVEVAREEEFAAAAIAGSDDAFAAIYDVLSGRLFNFVLRTVHERATAEDICQEVWIKAHREIRSLKSPQALRTWLFRMASRSCIDYSRSRAYRDRQSPEISDEMLNSPSDEPEVTAIRQNEIRLMWEALAALPVRQSMALYLKQVDGCSYDEIGRILGCRTSAVETLLYRARHGLARAHELLQTDPQASCRMIGETMAVVLDKEGTAIQQRAVAVHVSDCRSCRQELSGLKRGVSGYVWLPMLPVGGQALTAALSAGTAGTAAGLGISRLVGALLVKGNASGLAVLAAGAVTATAVAGAAGFTPLGALEDAGSAVRDVTFGGGDSSQSVQLKTEEGGQPPLAPLQLQNPPVPAAPLPGSTAPVQSSQPPASGLDRESALSGLPDLLQAASNDTLASIEPLLSFFDQAISGTLEDPVAALQELLDDPGGAVDSLAEDAGTAVRQTTQNTTTTVDDTVDQTTDLVDGLLGEDETTGPIDETVEETTDIVDDTVDGVTGVVDETTDTVDDTLGGITGDDDDSSSEDDSGDDGGLLDDLPVGDDLPCVPLLLQPC